MKNPDRTIEIAGFLTQHGWDDAMETPFDADFSSRRYARLLKEDNSRAVLMDADNGTETEAFVDIDRLLIKLGLSAPEIFAAYAERGLVLMEDFGGKNFGALLDAGLEAPELYKRAVDVLVHLHKNFDKNAHDVDLPIYGGALFASQVEMFIDWYFPHAMERDPTPAEAESFRGAWKEALKGIDSLPSSLLLRDFMPDNLMDLPKREGLQSVGLLDFQDAGLGPVAYDLASLCEMVRRNGGDTLLPEMIAYYHAQAKPALSVDELENACAILGAQRHMRILGIIAKLSLRDGRDEKLAYAPRIWSYMSRLLQNQSLRPVQDWLQQTMRTHDVAY